MRKAFVVMSVVAGSLVFAPSAGADIPSVFGGDVACTEAGDGVRQCGNTSPRSTTNETFDGVPLDINVAFPPDPNPGPGGADGPYPLIVWGHGYGGAKIGFGASGSTTSGMRRFTSRGYAVMSMTTRGFRESCGSAGSQAAAGAACDDGFVRLMDTRYEVRDYQDLAGELAEDNLVVPTQIGAVGGSYGGGLSMALGALKNRQMTTAGNLVPWESPDTSIPMSLAAAVPNIPWTDLSYSLVPNGRTLDYIVDNDYGSRMGVMKESLVNGLYVSGELAPGFYAPLGTVPSADLTGWRARLSAGEPYDGDPTATSIIEEIKNFHSSYYIDSSVAPAPMLMSSGFTDDLFPADETIRYYNRTKVQHPGTPLSLFFGDFGHQRSANKSDVSAALVARENQWLDYYVKNAGSAPPLDVTAYTQTCPSTSGTPSEGPFTSTNWATAANGELRLNDNTVKTISADGPSASIGTQFDPVVAGSNACKTVAAADEAGTANYPLPAVTEPVTLMGATSVIADFGSGTPNNEIAARLFDVLPDGTERLVARGLWRPEPGISRQVFQLHPNGYTFRPGSIPRLQLLSRDWGGAPISNYGRRANGQGDITVSKLEVRLPVIQRPGADGGAVKVPRDEFVPAGRTLHPDFAAIQNDANATIKDEPLKATKKAVTVNLGSPGTWVACHATVEIYSGNPAAPVATTSAKGKGKKKKKKKKKKKGKAKSQLLGTAKATIAGGQEGAVTITLNKAGRKLAKKGGRRNLTVRVSTLEQDGYVQATRKAQFKKKKKKKKKKGKRKKK